MKYSVRYLHLGQTNFTSRSTDPTARPFLQKAEKNKKWPKKFLHACQKKLTNFLIDAVQIKLIKTAVGKVLHYF